MSLYPSAPLLRSPPPIPEEEADVAYIVPVSQCGISQGWPFLRNAVRNCGRAVFLTSLRQPLACSGGRPFPDSSSATAGCSSFSTCSATAGFSPSVASLSPGAAVNADLSDAGLGSRAEPPLPLALPLRWSLRSGGVVLCSSNEPQLRLPFSLSPRSEATSAHRNARPPSLPHVPFPFSLHPCLRACAKSCVNPHDRMSKVDD